MFSIWVIFTHLKLWVAVASHNFKWVKMQVFIEGLISRRAARYALLNVIAFYHKTLSQYTIGDAVPAIKQHWSNVSILLRQIPRDFDSILVYCCPNIKAALG